MNAPVPVQELDPQVGYDNLALALKVGNPSLADSDGPINPAYRGFVKEAVGIPGRQVKIIEIQKTPQQLKDNDRNLDRAAIHILRRQLQRDPTLVKTFVPEILLSASALDGLQIILTEDAENTIYMGLQWGSSIGVSGIDRRLKEKAKANNFTSGVQADDKRKYLEACLSFLDNPSNAAISQLQLSFIKEPKKL